MTAPHLGYDLTTDPAPLAVSVAGQDNPPASMTLAVTNDRPPVVCDTITVHLPVGTGPGHLVQAKDADRIQVDHPAGWDAVPVKSTPGKFELAPSDETAARILHGTKLEFTFSQIQVNSEPGAVEIAVTEKLDGSSPAQQTTVSCAKAPGGLKLHSFRPRRQVVRSGTRAQLVWTYVPAAGASLDLQYVDALTGLFTRDPVDKIGNYEVTLYADTAFVLHGYLGDRDAPKVSYLMHTYVTVSEPYVHAHDLTAQQAVSLLGRFRPHTPQPRLDPPPSTTSVHSSTTWTAGTDGLLTGSVRTFFAGTNAQLQVTVTPPKGTGGDPHTAYVYCADETDPRVYAPGPGLCVPVPEGSSVEIDWDLVRTADFVSTPKNAHAQLFATALDWHPWGTGGLVPASGGAG
ncbi:hypothetical protein ACSNOH_01520 [Streptomyces sp. URMC 127]|uniref:hypothetical protein n=1 Tax=Streptomyces sp. URMC 127 TaxID=3423402 RepID=UPI003F1CBE6E